MKKINLSLSNGHYISLLQHNNTIYNFKNTNNISEAEYNILFEAKDSWYSIENYGFKKWSNSEEKIKKFNKSLQKVIELQKDSNKVDLSHIQFPIFNFKAFESNYYKIADNIDIIFDHAIFWENIDFSCMINLLFDSATFNGDAHFNNGTFGYADFRSAIFKKEVHFDNSTFKGNAWFEEAEFSGKANFVDANFIGEADFYHVEFGNITNFMNAAFHNKTILKRSTFKNEAYFNNSIFKKNISFEEVHFQELFDASKMSFNLISLTGVYFKDPSLLGLSSYNNDNRIPLGPKNFVNKESARIIKAHFEKAGNITEANKYFVIEQEKYIDDLWSDEKYEDKRITKLIPLYLNKCVSNFGTNWVRGILFLLLFGIAFQSIFNYIKCESNATFDMGLMLTFIGTSLSYHLTYIETRLKIKNAILVVLALFLYLLILYLLIGINNLNDIVKLLNPINAFKDDDTFNGYEAFGMLVRIVSATIIYQLIVAFRQNTRRS